MPNLVVGSEVIPWSLRISPRAKRLRIIVRPGAVEVVAPVGWPMNGPRGVLTFVESKREWVREAVRKVGALAPTQPAGAIPRCDTGATVVVRGAGLALVVDAAAVRKASVVAAGDGARVEVVVPHRLDDAARETAVRSALAAWLGRLALVDARAYAADHGARLGRLPADVRLTNARRRWGSCSAAGVVRVHWRLVQAPPPAFEYVVAHEIAHLAVRDHSARFWGTVGALMPEYPERRAALKAWERAHAGGGWLP